MITRASEIFHDIVGKSKLEKGIGFLNIPDDLDLLEGYFNNIMIHGFGKFFPEIFISH